ncbi:Ubiquitin-specific protease family C19 protein [Quillaja saponaria]|uniref:Ubiquitin-specific protease family C19 protein n=1 Tax=Quillaja saponaria TaxID=32244 RepID=A0AAD7Q7M8_QUISA|nr:Ubiquitin-specific protease family C19 protein [Quillaja saponaria]
MGSRFPSHQLSNGLHVSGLPQEPRERSPKMSSVAKPYTGGDIKKFEEMAKMFAIPIDGSKSRKSGPSGGAAIRSGPFMHNAAARSGSTMTGNVTAGGKSAAILLKKNFCGPLNKHGEPLNKFSRPQSGRVTCQNSAAVSPVLPVTGLITSGPTATSPLNSYGVPRNVAGPFDSLGPIKSRTVSIAKNPALTTLSHENKFSFRRKFPRPLLWSVVLIFLIGFIAGGFILGAVHKAIPFLVIVITFGAVAALYIWNTCGGRRAIVGYISQYPDAKLRTAKDGQYVKISGVVTCGPVTLESSFQKVPRCVYTSTSLYEYRGWDSKAANSTHRYFTWGLRFSQSHIVDFYISDFHSGLRALVKTGYGARVTPCVDDSHVIDVNPANGDMSPEFVSWLGERNLSSDDRKMRLKEGYIQEGSTVSVMGVVRRTENLVLIVPPPKPLTIGCQGTKCIFPASLEGIVLSCEDTSENDVIPV